MNHKKDNKSDYCKCSKSNWITTQKQNNSWKYKTFKYHFYIKKLFLNQWMETEIKMDEK